MEFDELLRIFDPDTRKAFQTWQGELAKASAGRGEDLNAAFGSFPGFTQDATDLLTVLDDRRTALQSLIRDTGTTFSAISRDEDQLREVITQTATVFETTASQRDKLAESFRIFPTFLDESKATLARVERFARQTDPLLGELRPALEDLQPTLVDVRRLSPDLRNFFASLDPLIEASKPGFPALNRVLRGLTPVFEQTTPFLSQLTPIFQYIEANQYVLTDFISIGGAATAGIRGGRGKGTNGHVLPQLIVGGSQSVPTSRRTEDNRGTSYPVFGSLADPGIGKNLVVPSFDCQHVGGPRPRTEDLPACFEQGDFNFKQMSRRYPHVTKNEYSATK